MSNHKLGVIVPYRDRKRQLYLFKTYISNYLFSQGIEHEIIVVEQADDKPFNRGMLINWGVRKAEWAGCDYVVFHDVDLLPTDVDYSYSDKPLHLVANLEIPDEENSLFYDYFGGVTMFTLEDIKKINGFSNNYYGWGFEDDDLFLRCQEVGLPLDSMEWGQRRHSGIGLQLNGKDSFIAVENPIKGNRGFTIFGSFTIDGLENDLDKEYDEMTIFSFPGPDLGLSYRSFMNFNLQLWDNFHNPASIHSKKYPYGSYNYCVTFDFQRDYKKATLYINGEYVGEKVIESIKKLNQPYIYLGVGDPDRQKEPNFFKGLINNFAIYNTVLTPKQIAEISQNTRYSLLEFDSGDNLTCYFDSKFTKGSTLVDLVGETTSFYHNCNKVYITELTRKKINIPFRRPGIFKALPHESNGFDESWADWSSRTNQQKYFKLLESNSTNFTDDGISSYWGEMIEEVNEYNYSNKSNYNHLYVKT